MNLLLDTGVLGVLCHPKPVLAARAEAKLEQLAARVGDELRIHIPEIADYELRRKLIHIGSTRAIARLDGLTTVFLYLPLTTEILREAARLWARTRAAGLPTASTVSLDGDVILAAQALSVGGTIATTNRKHIAVLGVAVEDWGDLVAASA